MEIFLIGSLIYGLICYLIGEFFGRAKHIGRWWTMFLFWSAPIPIIGLLALIFSPSAKKPPTLKRNFLLISLGVIFLLLSIAPLIRIFTSSGYVLHFSYIYFTTFVIHGIYFILLGNCNVKNLNPKYYFNEINFFMFKAQPIKSPASNEDENLTKLKELLEMGIINSEEFKDKKQKLENKKKEAEELKKRELEEELEKEKRALELKKQKVAIESLKSLMEAGVLTLKEYNEKLEIIENKKNKTFREKKPPKQAEPVDLDAIFKAIKNREFERDIVNENNVNRLIAESGRNNDELTWRGIIFLILTILCALIITAIFVQ